MSSCRGSQRASAWPLAGHSPPYRLNALTAFFDQYVFGHDRADLLAALLPASDADRAEAQARQAARLHTELARIDTAERGLISEPE